MDASLLPVRDFSDLTRTELITRLKRLKLLQAQVEYTRGNLSPRELKSACLAMLMLFAVWILTASFTCSAISGAITLAWVMRYSRLPRTWHAQLQEGISRLECLRSSPLRHMYVEQDAGTDWHYASYCLAAEIERIQFALSEPARPFRP